MSIPRRRAKESDRGSGAGVEPPVAENGNEAVMSSAKRSDHKSSGIHQDAVTLLNIRSGYSELPPGTWTTIMLYRALGCFISGTA